MTHDELEAKALSRPEVKAEYDALEGEFALLRQLLLARQRAGLEHGFIERVAQAASLQQEVKNRDS